MKVRDIKQECSGRRFVIKEGSFSPVDTSNSNVVYVGKLKTDRYNNCKQQRQDFYKCRACLFSLYFHISISNSNS